jgi:membrane-associated phospholipid phosphatase
MNMFGLRERPKQTANGGHVPQRFLCALFAGTLTLAVPASGYAQQTPAPAAPEVHPTPAHTGLAALLYTTADDFKALPQRKSTWVILGTGAAAALLVHAKDDEINDHLQGSRNVGRLFAPGKYLGAVYTQAAVSVGLYTIGRYVIPPAKDEPRTNKISHMGFDLLRAQIVSQTIVQGMKHAVRRARPTGECCAMPSGHAATAFAAASVLERHYGYRMAWPTLAAAAYVGASRLHDNRHFASDVLFGSAVGMATGWTIVGRHGRSSYALRPVPIPGGIALVMER